MRRASRRDQRRKRCQRERGRGATHRRGSGAGRRRWAVARRGRARPGVAGGPPAPRVAAPGGQAVADGAGVLTRSLRLVVCRHTHSACRRMMTSHQLPHEIRVERVSDFLRVLSPVDGKFLAYRPGLWAYRGLPDCRYELLPSAFRPTALLKRRLVQARTERGTVRTEGWGSGPLETCSSQGQAEAHTLLEFYDACQREGLRVPNNGVEFRIGVSAYAGFGVLRDEPWPPNGVP